MRTVTDDIGFPEAPVVLPGGDIAFVEMRLGLVSKVSPNGHRSVIAKTGGGPNGLAMGPGGKLYVCNSGGMRWIERHGEWIPVGHDGPGYSGGRIERIDLATGEVKCLYRECGGRPLGAPNDIVFDADGNFWFTDPGRFGRYERDQGAVFWAAGDGSAIRRVIDPLDYPNGIALSPDGRQLYVADTPSARLWSWEITGSGTVRKLAGAGVGGGWLIGGLADVSRFDGIKVTASGRICVATFVRGGITEFWPDGSASRFHPVADAHVTNLAFGGDDLRTMYITCGERRTIVETAWHEPGLKLNFSRGA